MITGLLSGQSRIVNFFLIGFSRDAVVFESGHAAGAVGMQVGGDQIIRKVVPDIPVKITV